MRTTALVIGGVLVVAAVVVAALTLLGGSSSNKGTASSAKTTTTAHTRRASTHQRTSRTSTTSGSSTTSAREESITVLNGTETTGLAHRISGQLQQRGYTQAAALSGRPAGANQETVVEYASGHQCDAEGVARSLGVSRVQPVEAAVASLGGSAKVVVIVGADKAAAAP
jgi:LytR cell envelope-related transcriptional attenuator